MANKRLSDLTRSDYMALVRTVLYPVNKSSTNRVVDKMLKKELIFRVIDDNDVEIIIPFAATNLLVIMYREESGIQFLAGCADVDDEGNVDRVRYTATTLPEKAVVMGYHYLYTQGFETGIPDGVFQKTEEQCG